MYIFNLKYTLKSENNFGFEMKNYENISDLHPENIWEEQVGLT